MSIKHIYTNSLGNEISTKQANELEKYLIKVYENDILPLAGARVPRVKYKASHLLLGRSL